MQAKPLQSHLTLCDPMGCSLPGPSVCGILQARILEWVAISFSKGTSLSRDQTWVSCMAGCFFTVWAVLDYLRPPLYLRAHGNYSNEPISTLPALSTLPSPCLLMQSTSYVNAHPWFLFTSDWGSVLSSLLYWVLPWVALLGVLCLCLPGICEYNLLPSWQSFPCLCLSPYLIRTNPGTLWNSLLSDFATPCLV